MTDAKPPASMTKTIYDLYRNTPELGTSSYLDNPYRRGLLDILPPRRSEAAAYAAWRAGRDTTRAATRKQSK